jgi:hypothetical protein
MRTNSFLAVAFLVVAAGCASAASDSGLAHTKAQLLEPDITFKQVNNLPAVARYISGGIPVHYQVRVANRSSETITLTRLDVVSLGYGAYTLRQQTRPYKTKIAPDHYEVVDFWAPAVIEDPTLYGANGPVTLRAVAHFDSAVGQFDHVIVAQVHERTGDQENDQ